MVHNRSVLDLAKMVWRRRVWMLVPVAAGLLGGLVAHRALPPVYRASTVILVESPRVPAYYVTTTVTTSLQERLQTIEQQITSRGNLLQILTEMKLYPELVVAGETERALRRVGQALTVEVRGNRIFSIYFKAGDPEVAARTANRFAELFIDENLRIREQQAESTSAFLEQELKEVQARLEEQEALVARFTMENEGSLPEQRQSNLASLAHAQTRLNMNLEATEGAEMRRTLLQREAAESPSGLENHPDVRRRELRTELERLRSQYTERHPDIARLQRELEMLEQQVERDPQVGESTAQRLVDPSLQAQLDAVELDMQRLEFERERLLSEIDLYQTRLANTPLVEQRLLILTRDYDNINESYHSLLEKRLDSRLAENLEKKRQSEQFRVLEEALPPREPFFPDLTMLLLAGGAAGGLLGFGLVLVREETDTTFSDAASLQAAFPGVEVLATLPLVKSRPSRRSASSRRDDIRRVGGAS